MTRAVRGKLVLYGALDTRKTEIPPFDLFARDLTVRGAALTAATRADVTLAALKQFVSEGLAHSYDQIPELVTRSELRVQDFYADLDVRLQSVPFIAGEQFSAADITGLATVDFAAKGFDVPLSSEHVALERWYRMISARASAAA